VTNIFDRDYDYKLGKDDCTFALRKIYKTCSNDKGLQGGDFAYRCVRYRSFHVNMGK